MSESELEQLKNVYNWAKNKGKYGAMNYEFVKGVMRKIAENNGYEFASHAVSIVDGKVYRTKAWYNI